ncbi:MAG TPA: hypothetical protein VND91_10670 [Candidatus Saccharimonadia bacterium]|nr:hypothetical protein [Candidatus Saccharimonadia bacterium]
MTGQRGIAFVIVLWVMALLAVLLGSFVVIARTENLQTRHLFDTTQARYAAEAGISRASYELRRSDPLARWVPDGRVYELEFDGAKIKVEITDESGKIDINAADEITLLALFQTIGALEAADAQKLVDAVMDFRDPDDLVRPYGAEDDDYEAAGLAYGALDQNFAMPEELQQVIGMSYELFEKLEPHITTFGLTNRPNPAFASATVLQTLPGITPDLATQIVQQRWLTRPGDPAAPGLTLPDGTPVLAAGGGGTYTVRSRATLPNRAWTILEATIRLGGAPGARAYSVLRWREGSAE